MIIPPPHVVLRFIRRQSRHSRVKITLFKSEIIVTAGDTRLFVRFIFKPLYNGEKKNLQHASEHTLAWAVKQPPCLKWNRNKNVNKLRVWEQFRLMWPHRERYLVLESKAAVCLMSWEKLPQQFVCRHLAFWHANPLNLSLNLKLHFSGYFVETGGCSQYQLTWTNMTVCYHVLKFLRLLW